MQDKKLKVVHILEGFLGGTSTYMCTVLPQLVRKGLDVTLISSLNRACPNAHGRISELRASGVKVHIIPMHREINPFTDAYSLVMILLLLSKNNFDVVHTHCSKAGALGRIAGFITGNKVRLHTPHCFAFTRCGNRFRRLLYLLLERALGRLTTELVAVSKSEADSAIRFRIVPGHRCTTVNNALSNGESIPGATSATARLATRASLGLDEDTQIVSTACRLVDYKGIFRFLEAARLSRTDSTRFLIAGDGRLRSQAERFIRENRLCDKVRLLGHVSDMESIYALSDIVTLCSDAEAQPYLLLEAMRARCPIVATSVIGNKDLISHDKTGFLVAPQPESIAKAIDRLLSSEEKRKKYADNAYAYFCRHHTLDKQISELTETYNSFV